MFVPGDCRAVYTRRADCNDMFKALALQRQLQSLSECPWVNLQLSSVSSKGPIAPVKVTSRAHKQGRMTVVTFW